jgi:hypothetical protein
LSLSDARRFSATLARTGREWRSCDMLTRESVSRARRSKKVSGGRCRSWILLHGLTSAVLVHGLRGSWIVPQLLVK